MYVVACCNVPAEVEVPQHQLTNDEDQASEHRLQLQLRLQRQLQVTELFNALPAISCYESEVIVGASDALATRS